MEEPPPLPAAAEDEEFHRSLRPRGFAEFVGQRAVVEQLRISVEAARARGDALDHVLFHGPPGLGKTSLAAVLARELEVRMHSSSGPLLPRTGDLVALLNALEPNEVLFLDEIHRLAPTVAEVLYPAMEDRFLDIMVGEKLGAQSLRITLPPFTLIGATTRADLVPGPLRDRFPLVHQLEFYSGEELERVLAHSAVVLETPLTPGAAALVGSRSRGTPRVANNLLRRIRDYAQVRAEGTVDEQTAEEQFALMQVDEGGLDRFDRKILEAVLEIFAGGPVGAANLAATLGMDTRTLEEVHEPFLIYRGLLRRTARGRVLTARGFARFGASPPPGGLFAGEPGTEGRAGAGGREESPGNGEPPPEGTEPDGAEAGRAEEATGR